MFSGANFSSSRKDGRTGSCSSGQSKWACSARPASSVSSSSRASRATRGSGRCGWRPANAPRARPTRDAAPWRLAAPMPEAAAGRIVDGCVPGRGPKIVFSGLDASVAGDVEGAFAAAGHVVVSNARNFRMDPLVPLLIPEVNADHLGLVAEQQRAKGWSGVIVTNPNCSTVVLASALAPLRPFGLAKRHRDHDAGGVRRRLPGRAVARHPRQRRAVHRRRGREDGDARRRRSSAARADAQPHGRRHQRAHQPRARASTATR